MGCPSMAVTATDLRSCLDQCDEFGTVAHVDMEGGLCECADCIEPYPRHLVPQTAAENWCVFVKGIFNLAYQKDIIHSNAWRMVDGIRGGSATAIPGDSQNPGNRAVYIIFDYSYKVARVVVYLGNTVSETNGLGVYTIEQPDNLLGSTRTCSSSNSEPSVRKVLFYTCDAWRHSVGLRLSRGTYMTIFEVEVFRQLASDVYLNMAWGGDASQWMGTPEDASKAVDNIKETWDPEYNCLQTGQTAPGEPSWWSVTLQQTQTIVGLIIATPDGEDQYWSDAAIYIGHSSGEELNIPMQLETAWVCYNFTGDHLYPGSQHNVFVCDWPIWGDQITIYHNSSNISICEVDIRTENFGGYTPIGFGWCQDPDPVQILNIDITTCRDRAQDLDSEGFSYTSNDGGICNITNTTLQCDRDHLIDVTASSRSNPQTASFVRIGRRCNLTNISNSDMNMQYSGRIYAHYGEAFGINCDHGYGISTDTDTQRFITVCQKDGIVYNGDTLCITRPCQHEVVDNSVNGDLSEQRHGDDRIVNCTLGYVTPDQTSTNFPVNCDDGNWINFQHCERIQCHATTENTNELSLEGVFEDVKNVHCNEGYIFSRGASINYTNYVDVRQHWYQTTCQASGQWSAVFSCERTPCYLEAAPPHYDVNLEALFTDEINVTCSQGYITTNDASDVSNIDFYNYRVLGTTFYRAVCQSNGMYSNIQVCIETPCYSPQPANTEGGSDMEGYLGENRTITCLLGYISALDGPTNIDHYNYRQKEVFSYTAACLFDGNWDIDFDCIRTPCYNPALAGTSAPGPLMSDFERSVTVTCSTGYITHPIDPDLLDDLNYLGLQIHNYETTCQNDGTFSIINVCIKTFCRRDAEVNITTSGTTLSSRYQDTVDQQCLEGYVTSYPAGVGAIDFYVYRDIRINVWTIECMSDGRYDYFPACTPTPCYTPQPENTVQGHLAGILNSTIEVVCAEGYITTVNGPDVINYFNYRTVRIFRYNTTCLATGEWSWIWGCTRTPCESPHNPDLANTSSGAAMRLFGDTFVVRCDTGYVTTMLGSPHVLDHFNYRNLSIRSYVMECMADGEFNYTVACVRTPCYYDEPEGTVTGPIMLRYRDSMQITCKLGHVTNIAGGPDAISYTNYRGIIVLFYTSTCLWTGEADLKWACRPIPCYNATPTNTVPTAPAVPDAPPNSVGMLVGVLNQQIFVECPLGYWTSDEVHSFGYNTICNFDGEWTKMTECELVLCPKRTILNSNVQEMAVYYLEYIDAVCDDGYRTVAEELQGIRIQCNADSTYSDASQTGCKYFRCDSLVIENSDVDNGTASEGNSLTATCNPGYESPDLKPSFSVRCVGLTWGDIQECIGITCAPITIARTDVINQIGRLGDILNVTCEDGYEFQSGKETLYIECLANKLWNDTDTCQPVKCEAPIAANCKPPNTDPNSGLYKGVYPNALLAICADGYETSSKESSYLIRCNASALFHPPPRPCHPKPCAAVPAGPRGLTLDIPALVYLQTYTAQCRTGHAVSSGARSQNLFCNKEGRYEGLRTCTPVLCPPLNAFNTNGHMTTGIYGLSLLVTCDVTYQLRSGLRQFVTYCQDDGTWSTQDSGEKIKCPPVVLPQTNVDGMILEAATQTVGFCMAGYSLGGLASAIHVRCDENGVLQKPNLVCELRSCDALIVPRSNVAAGVQLKYMGTKDVHCDVGYNLNVTSPTVICTSEAKLSPAVACVAVMCPKPTLGPSIATAGVIKASPYGTKVQCSCNNGYTQLHGDEMLTCQADGTWTAEPYCLKDCPKIPNIKNGKKSNNFVKSSTKVIFTCNKQFKRVGPEEATCLPHGEWSNGPCTCAHIAIDGYWTPWSDWSTCPSTCDGAIYKKERLCVLPLYGGQPCEGNATQFAECNTVPCPVDGEMSEWGSWGLCEATLADCAKGHWNRYRKCIPPRHNGRPCPLHTKVETEDCDLDPSCREKNAGSSGLTGDDGGGVVEVVVEMTDSDAETTVTITGYVAVSFMCFVIIFIISLDCVDIWIKIEMKKQATKFKVKRESRYENAVGNVVSITSVPRPET